MLLGLHTEPIRMSLTTFTSKLDRSATQKKGHEVEIPLFYNSKARAGDMLAPGKLEAFMHDVQRQEKGKPKTNAVTQLLQSRRGM